MALIDNLDTLKDWANTITNALFIIAATITGFMVAGKFINSRDKKEAMNYAIWWIAGVFFFFVCRSIIVEFSESYGGA
jgi:DMSO reductase anchor subunit